MRVICVLHDHLSATGFVGSALRDRGYQVDELVVVPSDRFHEPGVECAFPDPVSYDLLVPMGSPWSAYDDELIGSWLLPELAWLRAAVDADIPVLGICFGGQALARALGGTVAASPSPELGWVNVDADEPALAGPWFSWHYDRFTLPAGAVEVARNEAAPQAFRVGRSLGLQFHPEVTPAIADAWLGNGGAAKARALGVDPDELRATTAAAASSARDRAYALVAAFLAS